MVSVYLVTPPGNGVRATGRRARKPQSGAGEEQAERVPRRVDQHADVRLRLGVREGGTELDGPRT